MPAACLTSALVPRAEPALRVSHFRLRRRLAELLPRGDADFDDVAGRNLERMLSAGSPSCEGSSFDEQLDIPDQVDLLDCQERPKSPPGSFREAHGKAELQHDVLKAADFVRLSMAHARHTSSDKALAMQQPSCAPLAEHLRYAQDHGSLEAGTLRQQLDAVQQVKEALHQENLELQRNLQLQRQLREHDLKQTESSQAPHTCVVCLATAATVVCLPCKHLALCGACSQHSKMKECPICRVGIDDLMQVFVP